VQKNIKCVTNEHIPLRKACWGLEEKHRDIAFYNRVVLQ